MPRPAPAHAVRRGHRVLSGIGIAVAVFAVAALLAPHHEVRESDLGALGCAFMTDCHLSPSPPETRQAAVHSGLHHGGALALPILLVVIAARYASLRRPRPVLSALAAIGAVAAAVAVLLGGFLAHMFDHVTPRIGAVLGPAAAIALVGTALADAVADVVLFVRERRRARLARV